MHPTFDPHRENLLKIPALLKFRVAKEIKMGEESYFRRGDLILFAGTRGLVVETFLKDQEVGYKTIDKIRNWQSIFKVKNIAPEDWDRHPLRDAEYIVRENSMFVKIMGTGPRTVGYTQAEIFRLIQKGTYSWSPNKKDKNRKL